MRRILCVHAQAPDTTGYCIAEIGRILFTELLAKECASDPMNNMDIVGVSNLLFFTTMPFCWCWACWILHINYVSISSMYTHVGYSGMGEDRNGWTRSCWLTSSRWVNYPSTHTQCYLIVVVIIVTVGAASSVFAALLPPGRSRYHGKFVNKEKVFITWERIKHRHDQYHLAKAQLWDYQNNDTMWLIAFCCIWSFYIYKHSATAFRSSVMAIY